ncbi:MAG: caspase family protein [Caldilineaceae bacterium]
MPKGISIHIGLNSVSPKHYRDEFGRPWNGALAACEADAKDMQALAQARGFTTNILLTEKAKARNVLNVLSRTVSQLQSGDTLFVTYSGHGGQVPDENNEEDDFNDETWVLYDRQLLDDELYAVWSQFKPGVRIIVLSDSCHSGTATRELLMRDGHLQPATPDTTGIRYRILPIGVRGATYLAHKRLYKGKQKATPQGDHAVVQADVLLISGCQDDQLSQDGDRNGLFTGTLLQVWNQGSFVGDYRKLHGDIIQHMPPEQQPNLFTFGPTVAALTALPVFAI